MANHVSIKVHTTPGGSNLVFFSLLKSRLSFQMSRVIRSWLLVSPLLLSNLNHLEYWDKPRKHMKVCGHYIFPKTGLAVGSLLRKNVCAQACLYLSAWVAFCSMFHAGLCDVFSFVLEITKSCSSFYKSCRTIVRCQFPPVSCWLAWGLGHFQPDRAPMDTKPARCQIKVSRSSWRSRLPCAQDWRLVVHDMIWQRIARHETE